MNSDLFWLKNVLSTDTNFSAGLIILQVIRTLTLFLSLPGCFFSVGASVLMIDALVYTQEFRVRAPADPGVVVGYVFR